MAQIQLNSHEARLLGVLIEKSLTTPDQYPLSLNAAVNGCNQKSNRWPVADYTEAEVHVAAQGLVMKHLAGRAIAASSRVDKYRHSAGEALGLDDGHLATLAELLMRGPQHPGELRSRVDRMAPTPSLDALQARLAKLIEQGYVRRLEPLPGERAERYVQLLCPDAHPLDQVSAPSPSLRSAPRPDLEARVLELEGKVAEMGAKLEELLQQLGAE